MTDLLPPAAEQALVFAVLAGALFLFIQGRLRYDLVALLALLVLAVTGVVAPEAAFAGFGHPAVITVAAILVISRGLGSSGIVEVLANALGRLASSRILLVASLTVVVTVFSAFMNNVGALALLMPVAVRLAQENDTPPSVVLMPLAFGSLLGGMTTLIGTPPNILIGIFRQEISGESFRMFDFAPVGVVLAVAGVAFITLVGWRLLPAREGQGSVETLFELGDYISELIVPEDSPAVGLRLVELGEAAGTEFLVVRVERDGEVVPGPSAGTLVMAGDRLLVEAAPDDLPKLLERTGLELLGRRQPDLEQLSSDEAEVLEAVILRNSSLVGTSAAEAGLRSRFGVSLLGVARRGERLPPRLKHIRFQPGDVILVQGPRDVVREALARLRCLVVSERELGLGSKPRKRRLALAVALFGTALATVVLGWLPVEVAFSAAALGMVLGGLVRLRELYESVEWPVIVLLGAMIPVGGALESSGGASVVAGMIDLVADRAPLWVTLGLLLLVTMFLSDVMNNAATAVIMAPIAVEIAQSHEVSTDPFLMTVAVGASCAFLTPVGHQSNTLVLGPGGYRFGDYWRMGLPLEILITVLSVPLILWVWPL